MTRYFAQNTPRAGLEHMMMSVPGFQKRGGGMMILSRFCYKPEDVDCRYCLHYRRRSCQVRTCPYIAERLKSGAIEYFDEGVFGNYGWDEPLGACGLIAWTSEGTPLWKNENYSIYDCYAISLDEEENLWFYYYDEFRLVRTNFKEDFVFELPIEGSGAFSVAPSGNTFLFQGGYQQRDKFYFLTAHGDHLGKKQEAKGIDKCPPQPTKRGVILSPRKAVCTVLLLHGVYLLGG